MTQSRLTHIVIVGGGTAGWMTAAALACCVQRPELKITLIESDQIATIGVGEATLPHLRFFNQKIGLDEREFMIQTQATFKLGIEFSNWGQRGDAYIHPFGEFGLPINNIAFHHYWRSQQTQNDHGDIENARELFDYSLGAKLAQAGRFSFPSRDVDSVHSTFAYAYHLDATLYAKLLREHAIYHGVERIEGKITSWNLNERGDIRSLGLEQGGTIRGDLFIDCSGFRSLLLGNALATPFVSWAKWLPCDRAIAVPCAAQSNTLPYTKAIAHEAGWRWRIPLQHRVGNGIIYSSECMSDADAGEHILQSIEGPSTASVNQIRFEAGSRREHWAKNCVAIGLSSGFLEPLESTSIYLIQMAIMKMVELLPETAAFTSERNEFNRHMNNELERIRDFLILHYHGTQRSDSDFWRYCAAMDVPDSLTERIELFKASGFIESYQHGLFHEPSWLAVFVGQNIIPKGWSSAVSEMGRVSITQSMRAMKNHIAQIVDRVEPHHQALARYLAHAAPPVHAAPSMSLYGARR